MNDRDETGGVPGAPVPPEVIPEPRVRLRSVEEIEGMKDAARRAGWAYSQDRQRQLAYEDGYWDGSTRLQATVTEQDRLLQGTIRIDRLQLADVERLRKIADAHIGHVLNDDGTCWTCAATAARLKLLERLAEGAVDDEIERYLAHRQREKDGRA